MSDSVPLPPVEPPPELVGKRLEGYEVVALLGRGGMGEVYKALDTGLMRHVAIKVVSDVHASDPTFLARFEREARSASAVSHPNVAHVYGIGRYGRRPYYVMEFVEGRTLTQLLDDEGRLDAPVALALMRQACEGLRAAHAKGIVHRDLKPDNLMVDASGRLLIVDFGLARRLDRGNTITQSDRVMGTPRYMAPEQARTGEADHRSDMYSLGATFYHLLSGTPPFDADTSLALMLKHVNEPLVPLAQRVPGVPASVAAVVERLLSKRPEGRYESYDGLLADLDRVRDGTWRPVAANTVVMTPSGPARAWMLPVATGVAALLAGVAILGYLKAPSPAPARRVETIAAAAPAAPTAVPVPTPAPTVAPQPTRVVTRPPAEARPRAAAPTVDHPPSRPGILGGRRPLLEMAAGAGTLAEMRRVCGDIDAYRQSKGAPPGSFDDLKGRGATPPVDTWGTAMRLQAVPQGYRLVSAGPDASFDTADDVVFENGRLVSGGPEPLPRFRRR